ncbi:MAG: prolyl oligopeptidase family serine peptidase [Muribaculaceae bacterium]|nr:prolyl oligopeptidase family serine peptidase [Muribaculaceae bacterium]
MLATFGCGAQKLTRNVGTVPDSYNFWLYTPASEASETATVAVDTPAGETTAKTAGNADAVDSHKDINDDNTAGQAVSQKKPVFIFLHGASLCGRNLDRVRRYGTIDAIEKGRKIDGYVIAPQNPGGAWNPRKVIKILDWLEDNHQVDKDRVYVLGMSLGGYGTIDVAATYPDRIAAAMALCGGGTVKNLDNLNNLPLWIIHGTGDRAVSVRESDKVVAAMQKALGGEAPRLVYDRIPGMNHSQPARMFYMPESYDWLLSHSLSDETRSVSDTFEVTLASLRKAYQGLTRGKSGAGHSASKGRARATKSKARAARQKARKTRSRKK